MLGALQPHDPDEETEAQRSLGEWGGDWGRLRPDVLRWSDQGSCTQGPLPGLSWDSREERGKAMVWGGQCLAGGVGLRLGEGWKPCPRQSETQALTLLASLPAASLPPIDLGSSGSHLWLHSLPGAILLPPLGPAQPGCSREAPGGRRRVASTLTASWIFRSPLPTRRPWAQGPGKDLPTSRRGSSRSAEARFEQGRKLVDLESQGREQDNLLVT